MAGSRRERFLEVLAELGGSATNARLRDELNWSDKTYSSVKEALIEDGLLVKKPGPGGKVALVTDAANDGAEFGIERSDELASDEDNEAGGFKLTAAEPFAGPWRKRVVKPKGGRDAHEPAQVLSYRHQDKRVNNPEVGMVHPENDPDQPRTVYKYDPHIDPALMFDSARGQVEQVIDHALSSGDLDTMREALVELRRMQAPYLNWAGKAERTTFDVDTVSLHVHERVDPATILANVRKLLKGEKAGEAWRQSDLFAAPFENLPLRQALDFYHHEKGWSNRLIAGDSLLVMNSLLQKESMAGQVQMIYFDPPYGIKYGSNFQPFTGQPDVKDRTDNDLTQEPEMIKAFRDTWELGIHSYLTYLRDRLRLAKDLLHESGSIFLQISEENVHHVREIMSDVFGALNFVADIVFVKAGALGASGLPRRNDYLIWYGKNSKKTKYNQLFLEKDPIGDIGAYRLVQEPSGRIRPMRPGDDLSILRPMRYVLLTKPGPGQKYQFNFCGQNIDSGNRWWGFPPENLERLRKSGRIAPSGMDSIRYLNDFAASYLTNLWLDTATGSGMGKIYVVQTAEKVIERCMLMTTDPGELVFDPTCGSGTTSFVAEKWGRRWITCDTSRVALTLAKKRLMTASFDYFSLRYPHEGLKGGFLYETVPHVMLQSIANNPEIDTIYGEMHPALESALDSLNVALVAAPSEPFSPTQGYRKGKQVVFAKGERLEEWEVPFSAPADWPDAAADPFAAFHRARQMMQAQMEKSIAAHAEPETLYDKPEVDKSRLRITGPFSLEAVPAPTVLGLDEVAPPTKTDASVARSGETSRQALWRDEMMKTGIRGKANAIFKFAEMETIPGARYLHASGTLDNGDRVAVSFGPEHAALDQKQVERAIGEAQTLVPRPKMVVFCAFTFDPEAAKDIDEVNWPSVTLLKVQMNTDLLTEDLKKARSSNQSFWLMGQPDVELKKSGALWRVEVNGFDYFDPRTGELTSGGKSKIAMWSLDIDYDGRSLMPHQVFFPMAGEKDGWNRLRKTIRAELDEDLLAQFHGTVSLPFEAGEQRQVAVKIVDDRGIESLKILSLV